MIESLDEEIALPETEATLLEANDDEGELVEVEVAHLGGVQFFTLLRFVFDGG